jgi:L-ascorbate metabolism protein UlaG (beta-lactamase superfamily)
MKLTWHGHACFSLVTDDGVRLMFDPFLDENPVADIARSEVEALDYILISHGHFDHFADAIPLAKQTDAEMIGVYEITSFASDEGVRRTHGMNIGGGHRFPFGYVKMTPAVHSGSVHGDSSGKHNTVAGGFWIEFENGKTLYHAGDTALIMEMQLLKGRVDTALLPIGDNFTMGPEDAARAVEMIAPRVVVPMHYDTWPLIHQDALAFAAAVGNSADVRVMKPGESTEL